MYDKKFVKYLNTGELKILVLLNGDSTENMADGI